MCCSKKNITVYQKQTCSTAEYKVWNNNTNILHGNSNKTMSPLLCYNNSSSNDVWINNIEVG